MKSLHGTFVVVGHAPDGGTLRFIPDRPSELDPLPGTHRLRFASDRSVRVKLEGIDAPEVNYEGYSQPLGRESRDALLAEMGFEGLVFDDDDFARAGQRVRGSVFTRGVDVEGRVIGYVVRERTSFAVDATVNARMIEGGHAYALAYDTQAPEHRELFAMLACRARSERRGVWRLDRTQHFDPATIECELVLPKLFRRAISFRGHAGEITAWLRDEARGEDDVMMIGERLMRLSDVLCGEFELGTAVFVAR